MMLLVLHWLLHHQEKKILLHKMLLKLKKANWLELLLHVKQLNWVLQPVCLTGVVIFIMVVLKQC